MSEKNKVTVSEDYLKNIEKKVEDLKTLIEISTIISSTLDFNNLMNLVMEKAKAVMDAEACSILLYNKNTNKLEFEVAICKECTTVDFLKQQVTLDMGQGIAGWVAQNLTPIIVGDVDLDNRFFKTVDKQTGFKTKSLIAVPLVGRGCLIGVAEILNPRHKEFFSDYDMEIFQSLCMQVSIAIENSLFHKESIERERHKQELDLASTLQKSFLPESPVFKKGDVLVSAINISAKQVGGDVYDFIEPADNKVGVFIGDISGKGVSAALYMAKIISDFRYIARQAESPDVVLSKLNTHLSKAPRGMFLTAVYMIIDTVTGDTQVSDAGHPPFLWISKGDVKVMSVLSGPPIGIIPVDYRSVTISLKEGDRLILLTDGVFDAKDKHGNRLGFDNFVMFVKEHVNEDNLIDSISDFVSRFSRGTERADDLTIVEIKRGA